MTAPKVVRKNLKLSFSIADAKRALYVFVSAMGSYFFAHVTDVANAQNIPVSRALLISTGVAGMHALFDLVLKDDSGLKN